MGQVIDNTADEMGGIDYIHDIVWHEVDKLLQLSETKTLDQLKERVKGNWNLAFQIQGKDIDKELSNINNTLGLVSFVTDYGYNTYSIIYKLRNNTYNTQLRFFYGNKNHLDSDVKDRLAAVIYKLSLDKFNMTVKFARLQDLCVLYQDRNIKDTADILEVGNTKLSISGIHFIVCRIAQDLSDRINKLGQDTDTEHMTIQNILNRYIQEGLIRKEDTYRKNKFNIESMGELLVANIGTMDLFYKIVSHLGNLDTWPWGDSTWLIINSLPDYSIQYVKKLKLLDAQTPDGFTITKCIYFMLLRDICKDILQLESHNIHFWENR